MTTATTEAYQGWRGARRPVPPCVDPSPHAYGEIWGRNAPDRRFREPMLIQVIYTTYNYGLRTINGLHSFFFVFIDRCIRCDGFERRVYNRSCRIMIGYSRGHPRSEALHRQGTRWADERSTRQTDSRRRMLVFVCLPAINFRPHGCQSHCGMGGMRIVSQ